MSDRNEPIAVEYDFPLAWTFVSLLFAGGLGWSMLTLLAQA